MNDLDLLHPQAVTSAPKEFIFRSYLDPLADDELLVIADGFGKAEMVVIEGNYPVDSLIKSQTSFESEDRALEAAQKRTSDL